MPLDQRFAKFGRIVKSLRIEKEITQEDLAEKANLHVTFISRIENGKANVSLDTVLKLANAFGIEVKDLFEF